MFDIGFLEILVIFVLGLVVIGPERLPSTIKTCAIWFSRLKRSVHEARAEFEQQIGADEIRREIHNQQILDSMRELGDAKEAFESKVNHLKDEIAATEESMNAAGIENPKVEPSAGKTAPAPPSIESDNSSKAHNPDEAHEPMIHDETGEDASNLPGRSVFPENDSKSEHLEESGSDISKTESSGTKHGD